MENARETVTGLLSSCLAPGTRARSTISSQSGFGSFDENKFNFGAEKPTTALSRFVIAVTGTRRGSDVTRNDSADRSHRTQYLYAYLRRRCDEVGSGQTGLG